MWTGLAAGSFPAPAAVLGEPFDGAIADLVSGYEYVKGMLLYKWHRRL
jgi:hypothetical protein